MSLKAFTDYLMLEKKYSKHTVTSYVKDISSFSMFYKENYQEQSIDKVNYAPIRNWIVHLIETGISNRSVNRKVASLKAYFKFLLKIGAIEETPLQKHKMLKVPKKVEIPFSEKEMEEVLGNIDFPNDFEGKRNKLIIELLYATGMRRSELINLKIKDIDIPAKTIRVLGKRNKERIIPLLDTLVFTIEEYMGMYRSMFKIEADEYFFLRPNGNKIYETLVYRVINNYFSRASTKTKKSPHVLRHTFATHMLSQGADLNSVKELLGHSSLASTQVYTHNSISELKKAYKNAHPRSKE